MTKKAKMSASERFLLGLLAVLLLGSLYYILFFQPTTDRLASLAGQKADVEVEIEAANLRAAKMDEMQKELDAIFAKYAVPSAMAEFDNLKNVINELNAILSVCDSYSINFGTVNVESTIARRNINLSFSCARHDDMKAVLRTLENSDFRCQIKDLKVNQSENSTDGGQYSVTAGLTYFEYIK